VKTMGWKELIRDKRERLVALFTIAIAVFSIGSYLSFLADIEKRPGVVFVDPIHVIVGPMDLTWPIFLVLYGVLITTLIVSGRRPLLFFRILRAYTILIALRILAMWLLPLDPPAMMIALSDPFVEMFMPNVGEPLSRDLFFSGHTSLLCMLAWMMPTRWLRTTFLFMAAFIGLAVVFQHVHYTVDVVIAPLAAFAAVVMSGGIEPMR
jgi:hypothetical protein